MSDMVSSESSLFWRLTIPPTRFDGFFCESVTHQFQSEPEPYSPQDHIWKCGVTESMINGVATVDIVIQRVEIKRKDGPVEDENGGDEGDKPSSSESHQKHQRQQGRHHQQEQEQELEYGSPSSAAVSHSQTQMQSQSHVQQQHDQPQGQQGQRKQQKQQQQSLPTKNGMPGRIHYKTIALHTPKTLAPLMAMLLDGSSTGDTPIRGKSFISLSPSLSSHFVTSTFLDAVFEWMGAFNASMMSYLNAFLARYYYYFACKLLQKENFIPNFFSCVSFFPYAPHSITSIVELEANAILYRGKYVFEIVLSEEIPSYMNPSPSSCHRVFDTLYHEIVATSKPDTSTADIWFEFYPHSSAASEATAVNASTQNRRSLPSMLLPVDQRHLRHAQDQFDDSAAVTAVGAHFEKLRKYRYFAEWIEREKQEQEEQRRRQLEEEWRIHQEHHGHCQQQQQQQQQSSRSYNPCWHLESPHHLSKSQIGEYENQQRVTWIEQPLPSTNITPRSSSLGDQQQQHHPQSPPLQRAEYHPREIPTYFQPLQDLHSSSPSSATIPPHQQQLRPPSQHQYQQHHSQSEFTQPRHQLAGQQQQPVTPPPALRIPVKDVSLGTFQVILQYIYTGSIGLSDEQIKDVDNYWNNNPENQLSLQQNRSPLDDENMNSLRSFFAYNQARDRADDSSESGEGGDGDGGGRRIVPRPPIVLPVPEALKEIIGVQQQQLRGGQWGQETQGGLNTSIKDIVMSTDIYTFTTASAQPAWIPCLPRDQRKEIRDPVSPPLSHTRQQPSIHWSGQEEQATGGAFGQSQGDEGGQTNSNGMGFYSMVGPSASSTSTSTSTASTSVHPPMHQLHSHQTRSTCSWESLLLAANLFHLQDLKMTALKAIKYHCQMLASRALINNNVMAEVIHDGFDRSNLDLQLVLGESILLSLLKLYRSRALMVHPEGVRVLRGSHRESGSGGNKFKHQQDHVHTEPADLKSPLEERFRHQEEEQQGNSSGDGEEGENEGKKSDDRGDDKKQQQEEGHLGKARTASGASSSPSARARDGGTIRGGRVSSRTRRSHRTSPGDGQGRGQAIARGEGGNSGKVQQQHSAALEHGAEPSISARTRTQTTSLHQQQEHQERTHGHGDDGGDEGQRQPSGESRSAGGEQREDEESEEGEERCERSERVTMPMAQLDHPECEAALQELCEELRERFLSMREVMEFPSQRDARSD